MEILYIQSYAGRNVFSHRPVIRAVIDIGCLYDVPTRNIYGFNDHLVKCFPGINDHHCSTGRAGGFTERLAEGTYLAHVTEHLVLELQNLMGVDVKYGRTRLLEEMSIYEVVFEYKMEVLAVECLISAVSAINSFIIGVVPDMEELLSHLRVVASETIMGPSTRAIYDAAVKKEIPVRRIGNENMIRLGVGKYSRMIEAALSDGPRCLNVDMAGDKNLTKQILAESGIPVPAGEVVYTLKAALLFAQQIGYPVVIKPCDANQGKGVTINISNEEAAIEAFMDAIQYSKSVIVEKYIRGKDYRLLVVGDKVVAVSERRPPFVTGDGEHSIRQLVELENENPMRGYGHEKPLTKIVIESNVRRVLQKNGLHEEQIIPFGKTVYLRENGNLSTGGTARDCTDELYPVNALIAVESARLLGLDIAGIDITAEDISQPIYGGNGAVIEVNAAPGLRMHLFPSAGKSRDVGAEIVDMLFPEGTNCTIPIVSVTGTNGKTTTTRLISHVLSLTGRTVGMTSTSGVYIGRKCIMKGDNTGPVSAGLVLSDKSVDAAVLETARGGIIRRGLGYDLADVGVVVNISEDHLGIDGIETIEDLVHVKSLVVEAVRENGHAVLNADDCMTPMILDKAKCNVILFSTDSQNTLLTAHVNEGGKAVAVCDGSIYYYTEEERCFIAEIEKIPITLNGLAACNIENSLAAVSALVALGVQPEDIKDGLYSFKPNVETNPGRLNIFDMGDFKVMVDYGHNTAGYGAVLDYITKIGSGRYVGVIGMPGDRSDKSIREVGKLCGSVFSKLYIKEDRDLRGRKSGEVAGILQEGAIKGGLERDGITIVEQEAEAFERAMTDAQEGDLVVVFYEEFEPLLEIIEVYKYRKSAIMNAEEVTA